jgi:hypothetical protein
MMPRLKRPASLVGAAQVLNDALHDLHARAGLPSLRDLVRAIGHGVVSRSRVHEAFTGERVPDWGLLDLLVEQLALKVPGGPSPDDEVRRFHALWLTAVGQPETDHAEYKGPSTRIHALLVIVEWVNAPLLPFPATRRLQQLVDAALTNSGATEFLINRRNSTDGSAHPSR